MMPNGDPLDGFFYPTLTLMMDSYNISHIPLPAHWKDKKRTAARQSHAGRTSIRDAIVILKLRHHVAPQRIQDILGVFFMFFFQYKMRYFVMSKIENPLFV